MQKRADRRPHRHHAQNHRHRCVSLEQVRDHTTRLAAFSPLAEAHRLQEKRYLYDTL